MDFLFIALIAVLAGLLYVWWSGSRLPVNYPPGPRGVPLIGYTPFMDKAMHVTFERLSKRYGKVFHVPLGIHNLVVLNDWASVKEALVDQSETFSGRPYMFSADNILKREDIVSSDGPIWKEKRRFTMHHLRNLGVGKTSMEDIIMEEVNQVIEIVSSKGDGKVDLTETIFIAILNIVWGIIAELVIAKNIVSNRPGDEPRIIGEHWTGNPKIRGSTPGRRYAYDDATMLKFSKTLSDVFDLFNKCVPINGFPVLRFLPGSVYPKLVKVNDEVLDFLRAEVEDHERSFDEGTVRDFIDIYLGEIKAKNSQGASNPAFQKSHMIGTLYNFFTAGVETTHNTLLWTFLFMATWPEIQGKVQSELDRVIGHDRNPTYTDRPLLPYTEAVLLEINRYATVVPGSIPHSNIKEAKVQGYTIPKDSFVIQNIWAIHKDPKLWGDPEIFRPERFLDESGKVKKPEYHIPFSLGPRQCMGESLAKMELFLFFTCILQRYQFRFPTGEVPPSFAPIVTITLSPQPFSLRFKRRW